MRVKPKDIILAYKREGEVKTTASFLGIHPATVLRWLKKATVRPGVLSSANLKRKSTRPKTIHRYEFTSDQRIKI